MSTSVTERSEVTASTGHSPTTRPITLRAIRARGEKFDSRFFERDPRFWPIARAAHVFAAAPEWPTPESYGAAFGERPSPVRFVHVEPRRQRRRRGPVDVAAMYDARIANGEVPTRAGSWHDFLNALVWATFPRAKGVLHRRQHEVISAWVSPGARTLPNARTREHDALALIDEGGVVLLRSSEGERQVPFGHALFEGIVLETRAMIARAVEVSVARLPASDEAAVEMADALLAERLALPVIPEDLPRVTLPGRSP
jgi:hypothetical protein